MVIDAAEKIVATKGMLEYEDVFTIMDDVRPEILRDHDEKIIE